jgi:ABC-2 type transport system ATP-binding protein
MEMDAIAVQDLRKDYGPLQAVAGVSFTVRSGEVFALLGPNGAGKTTTVEMLEGYRHRSGGSIAVLGFDPETGGRRYRDRIGIVLQEAGFEEEFTVLELVKFFRGMYSRRLGVDAVIDIVGLSDKRDVRVKVLSGGQRRRLDLALGIVGDPDVLFLDEPTTGFDPAARRHAWELVEMLRNAGKTVLLTTHYMDEAEHLADRVGVMVAGRLVTMGTPGEISSRSARTCTLSFRLPSNVGIGELPELPGALMSRGADWQLRTDAPTLALLRLTSWAQERRLEIPALTVARPSLEDVYLDLVGSPAVALEPSSS